MFGKKRTGFGRLVIGERRAKEEVEEKKNKASKYGPLVRGTKRSPDGTAIRAAGSKSVPAGALSVNQLRELLKQNPTYVTVYYDREATRRPFPRLPALMLLLDAAKKQRDPVLTAKIEGAIVSVKRLVKDQENEKRNEKRSEIEAKGRKEQESRDAAEADRLARLEQMKLEREQAVATAEAERQIEVEAARKKIDAERVRQTIIKTERGPDVDPDADAADLAELAGDDDDKE